MIKYVLLVLFLAGIGCSRRHMSDDYGVALRHAFTVQVVRVGAPEPDTKPLGLDSEEARIVYDNYRQSLGAEEKGSRLPLAGSLGMIIVEERDENDKKERRQ